jgi:hypothetical protein
MSSPSSLHCLKKTAEKKGNQIESPPTPTNTSARLLTTSRLLQKSKSPTPIHPSPRGGKGAGTQTLDDPISSREPRVFAPVFDRRLLGFPAPVDRFTSCWFWWGEGGIRGNGGVEPRVVGHRTQSLQGSVLITPHRPRRGERILPDLAKFSARCFFGD